MSKKLGEGTFGIVYAVDNDEGSYALKRNLSETDSSFMGAIRELNMLYILKHPNIVKLESLIFNDTVSNFSPLLGEDRETQRDDSVHFVFEKGLYDLHDYIHNNKIKEQFKFVKKYMVDCLLALEYMHYNNIVHRDLKPGNVLLYPNNIAKLCDFGFSKPYTIQGDQTPGIVTIFYRAPEILLNIPNYDYKVDVWSMGCIFYEMVCKKSFVEEESDENAKVMKNVLAMLPAPLTKFDFKHWVTNNTSKDFKIRYVKNEGNFRKEMGLNKNKIALFERNCGSMDEFVHLLNCMLRFNPNQRYTVSQCLDHVFFDELSDYVAESRELLTTIAKHKIQYPVCIERKWMADIVNCLYNNKDKLEWYNERCLFQAIDMFHRYLYTMHYHADKTKVETETQGLIHNEFYTNLLFMACIYIAIKYFSTIHYAIPFSSIVQEEFLTPECLLMVEQFEGGLIKNCFHYDIYHNTLYESASTKLSDIEIKNLLYLTTMNDYISDNYVDDVFNYYKDDLKLKSQKRLLLPMKK